MAQACQDLDRVLLELLARAAPVPLLAAGKVGVDGGPVEHQPGRQPAQDRDQRRPVRLTGSRQAQRHGSKPRAVRITLTGGSTPVHS